ncbi:hypothetical protein V5O48_013352 [Marasmius crinis-equi]|uniref:Cytochrome P450 n=1 Tax=Marasmius crinis-equi TaxID=585013 RepID=A0ABR3F0C1_9AGAR
MCGWGISMDLVFALLAASFTFGLVWFARKSTRKNPALPPGPPGEPLIGHLRVIPPVKQAETFHEWAKEYGESYVALAIHKPNLKLSSGDVIYLKVLGKEMIVLDTVEAAQEILEVRGAIYSCRPRFTVFELQGWVPSLTFLKYGKQFLKHRRMLQQYFGRKEILSFDHIIQEEARLLVGNLSNASPGDHLDYVHRFTLSNIMRAAFGHPVRSDDDIFVKIGLGVSHALNHSGPPGNTPVDFFPWLRHFPSWFPGTYYAYQALSQYKVIRELYDVSFEFVRTGLKNKTIERCFASEKIEHLGDSEDVEEIEDIKGAVGTIFAAGEDTTFASLCSLLMALIHHPECQQRAYDEIISVVGHDRIPDLNDRQHLPYLECVVQELYRWHPVGPLGVPHRATKDDVYNGMFIPKGTMVISNIGGMSIDERVYFNPKAFDPTRYLPVPEGKGEPRFTAVWGFGRRICPGRYFADMVIWNAVACILSTLELLPAKGENRKMKLPEISFSEGLISQALPFDFEVRPRSEAAKALIVQFQA